jgi:hypothetical protein
MPDGLAVWSIPREVREMFACSINSGEPMRKWISTAAVCLIALPLFGADAPPIHSEAGRAAVAKHDAAVKRAETAYKKALTDADRQEVADLEVALRHAMDTKQLDEANALNAEKKAAMDRMAGELGKVEARTFTIYANTDWQPTIQVQKGEKITVRAEGVWQWCVPRGAGGTCGPNGQIDPSQHKVLYYLVGRISQGEAFKIGSAAAFTAGDSGMLSMQMMDTGLDDNAGNLSVTISAH